MGNIYEPTSGHIADARVLFRNFFSQQLSWGEASTASLKSIGAFSVPIGDPLVVLTVYNPDVNGDRKVDAADYQIVQLALGTSNPQADINDDGIVDQKDINLVREAYGQNYTEQPTEPFPGMGCGDLGNEFGIGFSYHDFIVDSIDLTYFYDAWTAAGGNPGPAPCPLLDCWSDCACVGDFNGDAIISSVDEDIILANCGRYLLDVAEDDGCVDAFDLGVVLDALETCAGDLGFNPIADINCDGCVTRHFDQQEILAHWGECESPPPCDE